MKSIIIFFSLLTYASCVHTKPNPAHTWVDKPWQFRQILFVLNSWSEAERVHAKKVNHEQKKTASDYLVVTELFRPKTILAEDAHNTVLIVKITFDRRGQVRSSDLSPGRWQAKLNANSDLVLINRSSPRDPPYLLAHLDDFPREDRSPGPTVCSETDLYYHEGGSELENSENLSPCQRWAAQLYDAQRPYIDLTPTHKEYDSIFLPVGWRRFSDPAKPVIGKEGYTWLCLLDCPAHQRAGKIANIEKWTRKHGFPIIHQPPEPSTLCKAAGKEE